LTPTNVQLTYYSDWNVNGWLGMLVELLSMGLFTQKDRSHQATVGISDRR